MSGRTRTRSGWMAERSKALVLGTSLFGGVGSNPTPINIRFDLFYLFIFLFFKRSVSSITDVSRLAQLVERKTLNLVVVGSSPTVGVPFCSAQKNYFFLSPKRKQQKFPDRELNPGLAGESRLS